VVLIPILFFAPESPWWLVRQGRTEEAKEVLKRLTSNAHVSFNIEKQVALMVVTTEHERTVNAQTSYLACFRGTDLRRTLVVMGVYCIQVLSGNPLRAYSTYFLTKAGLPSTQAFNMTLISYALALVGGFFTVRLPNNQEDISG
jgi:SP family general alpha glucoside:H+ symporter-like MFS transporter